MIHIPNISNRIVLSLISALILSIIGYIDWVTGYELSLSIFYLVPISLLALYRNVNKIQLIINSFHASFVLLLADYYSEHTFSNIIILYWDALTRFTIYLLVSLLIFRLKNEHKKLMIANDNLRKMNEEKNIFLGIAAHDLRNPISATQSLSEIILNDENLKKEEVNFFIETIYQANCRAMDLVTNLLDVSRIESGIVNIKFQKKNYIEFLIQCIELNQIIANKKEIKILFETGTEPITLEFDPIYLEEVINNLLSNAIKYSYPKSIIKIKVSVSEKHVLTEIIDNGVGISSDEIAILFNPFQKSSSKPTSGESSSGLGLAIVKKIIVLHNGEVGIKSELNKGSNVYFSLPLKH